MISEKLGYKPVLFIDDGHGQETPGKRTPMFPNGTVIRENEFNRPTAEKLGTLALAAGFEVVQLAPELTDVPLRTRTNRANKRFRELLKEYPEVHSNMLGVLVSIHFNALTGTWDKSQGGVSTWYYPGSIYGEKLARIVQAQLIKGTPQRDYGVQAANFHMTRESQPVAVLIEAGFMDVTKEAVLMKSPAFQDEVARETLNGIMIYLGAI